jgi:Zn-dependent M16 (insulinase) family peptidase
MSNEIDYRSPIARLEAGAQLHGFTVERAEPLPERGGYAYIMRHDATGARLMWLACDDNNKSFAIGFKTPPADDTGTFHILEHSVLCGSERYPVKEPFVNLLKTSMQTFLNALTFSDKTMYPVGSTNTADLENLMDVYLDAVLHPNIYTRPRIFEQEGWHYEIADDGSLVYNGVVFNEMKGATSDPDDVLVTAIDRELFPDTCYRFDSGGDPAAIPTITYEEFLDNHRRHYDLSNSYIIL